MRERTAACLPDALVHDVPWQRIPVYKASNVVPVWPELKLARKASSRRWTCHSGRSQFADDYDRASLVTLTLHHSGYLGSQQNDEKANDYVPTPRKELKGRVRDGSGNSRHGHDHIFRRYDRSNVKRRRRSEAATGESSHHDLKRAKRKK